MMPLMKKESPIIRLNGVSKEYKNFRQRVMAVDNIYLDIQRGEVLGILGPNGAGKTSIIKMICGLLIPDKGDIEINNYSVLKERKKALKKIGVVLEGNRNIHWRLTCNENLEYFGNLKGIYGKVLKERKHLLLSFFNLSEKRNVLGKDLSLGMQKKLSIAIALITDPEILLLDEIFAGLDVHSISLLKEKIKNLSKEREKTILFSTHQMDVAQEILDRAAIINQGKLVARNKVEELMDNLTNECYKFTINGKLNSDQLKSIYKIKELEIIVKNDQISFLLKDMAMFYRVVDMLKVSKIKLLSIEKIGFNLEEVYLKFIDEPPAYF